MRVLNLFAGLVILVGGCASLERDDGGTPPDITVTPPTDTAPPDVCDPECERNDDCNGYEQCEQGVCVPPECECDDDCDRGEACHRGACYERCYCDDDCSGPDNASCDNGLCKGHN